MTKTKREVVENFLLQKYKDVIKPLRTPHKEIIHPFKDGSFGVSISAYAMYANGWNPRGTSSYFGGLLYHDEETIFAIGYYRKKSDPEDDDGYLFIVGPRGEESTKRVDELSSLLLESDVPCKGVYVRFLTVEQYGNLLQQGFLPAKESPWHPESAEEDEQYGNALVSLDSLLELNGDELLIRPEHPDLRRQYNRFANFLERNMIEYTFENDPLPGFFHNTITRWYDLVKDHFKWLTKEEKEFGSYPEDYKNLMYVTRHVENGFSLLGRLRDRPVSVFVGEPLSDTRIGLYASISLRDVEDLVRRAGLFPDRTMGITALPTFALVELFKLLKKEGFTEVHLGGSETAAMNKYKRRLGAKNMPSYWAVKLRN
ncbi:hypothetical protein GOV09_04505 [Candidatus Woesearchaeota archaeon]|nr:hypothetical protein [Candidatus Woesearchaeota archaeon]